MSFLVSVHVSAARVAVVAAPPFGDRNDFLSIHIPYINGILGHHSLIPCFLSHKEVLVHAGGRLLLLLF